MHVHCTLRRYPPLGVGPKLRLEAYQYRALLPDCISQLGAQSSQVCPYYTSTLNLHCHPHYILPLPLCTHGPAGMAAAVNSGSAVPTTAMQVLKSGEVVCVQVAPGQLGAQQVG